MRVAVVGHTGQLGSDVRAVAQDRGHDVLPLARPELDLTRPASVEEAVAGGDPDLVVNAAAWTDVDACESDPDKAFDVNALGARRVAEAARQADADLVHTSTDYVFPGDKPPKAGATTPETAYLEDDATGPLNVYGASKLAGDHLVQQVHPDALVVRLSSVFGTRPPEGEAEAHNFVDTMLGFAAEGRDLQVVDDQHMTPTYSRHAAQAILDVAGEDADAEGLLHVTNPEACTWYDLAEHAVRQAGYDVPMERVTADAFLREADRPRNSALCTDRLQEIRDPLPGWREAVEAYLDEKERRGELPDPSG